MAMETIGLGGKLMFDPSRGVAGMRRTSHAFQAMQRDSQRAAANVRRSMSDLKDSMSKASEGMRTVGMAALPMTIGMGIGVAKAASFEKQMSNVKSILRGATTEEFRMLNDEARRLGIVSVFSAQQAGEAMENLAVLGLKPLEIMQALGPTLDAAAVAGIGLGEAALYVGGSTRAMGLAISETARVADVLTVAGQKSATTLPLMAESLKLAAPSAVQANMSLEETVSILGKLADAQLRGTLGATAFVNMMNKLAGPTREAEKMLADMNVTLTDSQGALRPIIDIVMDVKEGLDQEADAAVRLGKAQEIFGIRGARAFSALSLAGRESTKQLQTDLQNAMGAAQESAETRLDNILGAFTLFGASLEGIAIELFTPFLDAGKDMVKNMTNNLNNLLLVMGKLREPLKSGQTEFDQLREAAEIAGWEIIPIAQGINDAIDTMVEMFKSATQALQDFGLVARDTFGPDTTREFAKFTTLFVVLAGVVGPVLLGVTGLVWALKGVVMMAAPLPALFTTLAGIWTWMSTTTLPMFVAQLKQLWIAGQIVGILIYQKLAAAFMFLVSPLGIALLAVAAFIGILKLTQIEGETMVESFSKNFEVGVKTIKDFFIDLYEAMLNFVIDPLSTLTRGWVSFLDMIGVKVPKSVRAFGEAQVKAGKTVKIERGPTQIAGAGQVARYVPFAPGRVAGVAAPAPTPAGAATGGVVGDVLGDLAKELAGEQGQGGRMEQMMKQATDAAESARQAAESAAEAAKKKTDTKVNIDGREVARATAKSQEEIEARSGAQATPWQRTTSTTYGAMPTRR